MTDSNCVSSEEVKNYFNSSQTRFPIPVHGKIDTLQFLEASKGVVNLIEQFGTVFASVKYDMAGNIEKILQVYNQDQERHSNLNDLVLLERTAGSILATDALLWLRRALHLIQRFFEMILEDNCATGGSTTDFGGFLKAAYKETLSVYHGWHLQILFSVLVNMCPDRNKLLMVMSLNQNLPEVDIYKDMALFTSSLADNVNTLASFYRQHQLECNAKV